MFPKIFVLSDNDDDENRANALLHVNARKTSQLKMHQQLLSLSETNASSQVLLAQCKLYVLQFLTDTVRKRASPHRSCALNYALKRRAIGFVSRARTDGGGQRADGVGRVPGERDAIDVNQHDAGCTSSLARPRTQCSCQDKNKSNF